VMATKVFEIGSVIDGERKLHGAPVEVRDRYRGDVFAVLHEGDATVATAAVSAAEVGFASAKLSPTERYGVLRAVADRLVTERLEIASSMVQETGFTVKDCLNEVDRAAQTMLTSAEEAKRITGEIVPISGAPGFESHVAMTFRVPVGVVAAITPFNSPLNTVCHKVGPALAAGNAVVLKPSSLTPLSALRVSTMLFEAGLPTGLLQLVFGEGAVVGEALLDDPRVAFYTFTGSTAVGSRITRSLGFRRANLELGNISGTIVCEDASIEHAAELVARGAFRKAGQVCTSVQRLYVQESVHDAFVEVLTAKTQALAYGDPALEATDVGPLISAKAADRAYDLVREAIDHGADALTGGSRVGDVLAPTVLANVPHDGRLMCHEAFAPIISIVRYDDFADAVRLVNATEYGLQAGVFTNDLHRVMRAARELDVGGVVINGTSSTRADLMPYGGVKSSGYGREGPRYAAREMTNERLVLVTTPS